MNPSELADWALLRTQTGTAGSVPGAIERLLHASNPDEAKAAYWQLDNCVVVQGYLFEAAPRTAAAVCAGICAGGASHAAVRYAVELLYELVAGKSAESEVALGNADLSSACVREVRGHASCLRDLVVDSETSETLRDLLTFLDDSVALP